MNAIICKNCNTKHSTYINDEYIMVKNVDNYIRPLVCDNCFLVIGESCYIYCESCNIKISNEILKEIKKKYIYVEEIKKNLKNHKCSFCKKNSLNCKIKYYPKKVNVVPYLLKDN